MYACITHVFLFIYFIYSFILFAANDIERKQYNSKSNMPQRQATQANRDWHLSAPEHI